MAPASAAQRVESSLELLSQTKIFACGRTAKKSCTAMAIVFPLL
jgi:hypothetical protein